MSFSPLTQETSPLRIKPFVHPPEKLIKIKLTTQEVALVADARTIKHHLDKLASDIDPYSFDNIFYNLEGGEFLKNELCKRWKRHFRPLPPCYPVEYHTILAPNKRTLEIAKPIPISFFNIKNTNSLLLDDLYDTGATLKAIQLESKKLNINLTTAVLVSKNAAKVIPEPQLSYVGFEIPDLWIGGCGTNLSREDLDHEFDRNSPLLVMPLDIATEFYHSSRYPIN